MKTVFLWITAIVSFVFVQNTQAQNHPCADAKIKHFSKLSPNLQKKYSEKSSFQYDLKYHSLSFRFPNLESKYLEGIITSYFVPKFTGFNQISFDFTDKMTIDSVIFHQHKLLNFTNSNSELTINLEENLAANTIDSISVYYHGIPDSNGFGSFEYATHGEANTPVVWSLSEPYGAKDWWPCKQSLDDKIDSIDVFITNPEAYKAASNGVLVSETLAGGMKTAHWKHRHPIAAYLIAVALTDYSSYSDFVSLTSGEKVEVLNYVFPEKLDYAQANTPNILDIIQLYSNLFIPYPFADEKYGHAQFKWGGGMEHQTMSFMVDFRYHLMAHELAHQWFGDYITCGSWHDIWLNEGFATYLDGITREHRLAGSNGNFDSWKLENILSIVSKPGGSVYVDDTTSIRRIFSRRLTYQKGAMLIHMLRTYVGDDAFFEGIKNYLNDPDLANGYAHTADLQYHLEQTYGSSLQDFFDDWCYGEGYPTYTIFYSQSKNKTLNISFNQTQSHTSVDFFNMKLPIKIEGIFKDTLIWFDNNHNGEEFTTDLDFNVTGLVFDPHHDVISGNSKVLRVDTLHKVEKVFLLPNPAKDRIMVCFLEQINPDKISIHNNSGKLVKEIPRKNGNSFTFTFDISDLKTGLYYISFYESGKHITRKFIKN